MRAKAGDRLLTGSGSTAIIVDVLGADGHPPYIVRWLTAGNIAMVEPDSYARVIPAGSPPRSETEPGSNATAGSDGQRVLRHGCLGSVVDVHSDSAYRRFPEEQR
jgi:hypothetical protein